jgi:hypothetical protein
VINRRGNLFGESLKNFQYLREVRPFGWISMPAFLKQLGELGVGVFWDRRPNALQRMHIGKWSSS